MDAASPFDSPPRLVAEAMPGDNAPALSVSELSQRLKRHVEDAFGRVRIRGEISGWKRVASGHCYLALKDADARIDGVLWKGNAARLAFAPADGVEVIATGKLTTYPGRSTYQIVIDTLELAGEGAMLALLETLKARLAGEGLFDPARKRPLPFLPRHIAVVTSPTGAVIRDILHRLEDRFPVRVSLWPVLVQGAGAAGQIAAAIEGVSATAGSERPDLMIVARGGGSIEDLWSFNEETVVRAVAGASLPVISAVGHETDTTLCDFAADRRAPTPTAAAEMAVPVRDDLLRQVEALAKRTGHCARRYEERARERFAATSRRLPSPEALLATQTQRTTDLAARLRRGLGTRVTAARGELAQAAGALRPTLLSRRLAVDTDRLAQLWRVAASLDPRSILDRGYAMVERRGGGVLTSATATRKAGAVRLTFADGSVDAQVERPRSASYVSPKQPNLFQD